MLSFDRIFPNDSPDYSESDLHKYKNKMLTKMINNHTKGKRKKILALSSKDDIINKENHILDKQALKQNSNLGSKFQSKLSNQSLKMYLELPKIYFQK